MIGKMGLFGGYVRLFWGRGGGNKGQGCGNYPSQMWMSYYDAEKVDGDGFWGWHDMTLIQLLALFFFLFNPHTKMETRLFALEDEPLIMKEDAIE